MSERERDPLVPRPGARRGHRLRAAVAAALALGAASPLGAVEPSVIESAIEETEEQIGALEAKRAYLGDCRDYGSTVVMLPDRSDPSGRRVARRELAEIRAALERAYPGDRYRQRREAAFERYVRMGRQWQDTCLRLQQSLNELLLAKRQHLVDLRNWLAEERRRQVQREPGPGELFGSGQYAAGCVFDLEVAGEAIKGDVYCRDVWGLGRFPVARGTIRGDTVRIEVTMAEWDHRARPFTWVNEGRLHYIEPARTFAYVAGGWTNGDADAAGQPIRREWILKPMDVEFPDRTRRPPPWSVYECRGHIKHREQDTDRDAFETCYAASRAMHERP
jgi:hypothetical protein